MANLTFEQVFTYVTLGLTLLHKLVDVAKWAAAQTANPDDDAWVNKVGGWLDQASTLLGYLPAMRTKVAK